MENEGAVDDLSYVLASLSEKNFYGILKRVIECSEGVTRNDCDQRSILSKDDITQFMDILNVGEESVYALSNILIEGAKVLAPRREDLRSEVLKFYNNDIFKKIRQDITTSTLNEINKEIDPKVQEIYKNLLSSHGPNGVVWLKEWLNGNFQSPENFKKFLTYPALEREQLIWELRVIKKNIETNSLSCNGLDLDLRKTVERVLGDLESNNYENFFIKVMEFMNVVIAAKSICPEFVNLKANTSGFHIPRRVVKVDVINLFNSLIKYFKNPVTFYFLKNIQGVVTKSSGSDKTYGINIFSSEPFEIINALTYLIEKSSDRYFEYFQNILQRLNPNFYLSLKRVLIEAYLNKHDNLINSITKTWNFLDIEEKEFAFNFVDRHLEKGINYPVLLNFYGSFLSVTAKSLPKLAQSWESREKFYNSFKDIIYAFSGDDILKDFKRFFSKDYLLSAIEILSSGARIRELSLTQINYLQLNSPIINNYSVTFDNKFKDVFKCFDFYENNKFNFVNIVNNTPKDCRDVDKVQYVVRILSELNSLNNVNRSLFNINLYDGKGLLDKNVLTSVVHIFKELEETWGWEEVLRNIKYYFNDFRNNNLKTSISNNLNIILKKLLEGNIDINKRNNRIRSLLIDKKIYNTLNDINDVLPIYAKWHLNYKNKKSESDEFECQNFMNEKVNENSCLKEKNKNILISDMQDFLDRSVAKNGNEESFLGCLVRKFASEIDPDISSTISFLHTYSNKRGDVDFRDNEKKTQENLTVLEKIDQVIREINFKNSYLGVQFQNAVAYSDNYLSTVKAKKRVLIICSKAPLVRCFRKMNKDELRRTKNAISAYEGLIEIDEQSAWLQSVVNCAVETSPEEAKEVRLLPLKDEDIKDHNAKILYFLSKYSFLSNLGRYSLATIGKDNLENFLKRKDLEFVNNNFLKKQKRQELVLSLEKLFKSIALNETFKKDLITHLVNLNYDDTKRYINILAKLSVILSSLEDERTVELGVSLVNSVINNWALVKDNFKETSISNIINSLEYGVDFFIYLRNKEEKLFNKSLNNIVKVVELGLFPYSEENQFTLFEGLLKNNKLRDIVYSSTDIIRALHYDDRNVRTSRHFNEIHSFYNKLKNSRVDFRPIQDYLLLSTKVHSCKGNSCDQNIHYDEIYRLLSLLFTTDDLVFSRWITTISSKEHKSIAKYLTELLGLVHFNSHK